MDEHATSGGGWTRRAFCKAAAYAIGATACTKVGAQGFGRGAGEPWSGDIVFSDRRIRLTHGSSDAVPMQRPSQGGAGPRQMRLPTRRTPVAPLLVQRWRERRVQTVAQALEMLNERDIGGGFRTSRNRLVLGNELVDWTVAVDGRGFTLRCRVPGNALDTRLRTPGPAPSGTDPAFELRFDIALEMPVELRDGRRFVALPPVATTVVQPPISHNLTADLTLAVGRLVSFLTGQDFIGAALTAAGRVPMPFEAPISSEVDALNAALRTIGPNDAVRASRDPRAGDLVIELRSASAPRPPG